MNSQTYGYRKGRGLRSHRRPVPFRLPGYDSSGTPFFSFQDLDSTNLRAPVKIRVETIAHYVEKCSAGIIAKKRTASPTGCPL